MLTYICHFMATFLDVAHDAINRSACWKSAHWLHLLLRFERGQHGYLALASLDLRRLQIHSPTWQILPTVRRVIGWAPGPKFIMTARRRWHWLQMRLMLLVLNRRAELAGGSVTWNSCVWYRHYRWLWTRCDKISILLHPRRSRGIGWRLTDPLLTHLLR